MTNSLQKTSNARAIAATIVHRIIQREISMMQLQKIILQHSLNPQGSRLVYTLCYGVFRHYFYLQDCLSTIIRKKTKAKIKTLLLIGLYQLIFMHKAKTAKHALINETVEAAKILKLGPASGFINASLRQLDIASLPIYNPSTEMPEWLIAEIVRYYPQTAKNIIANSNQQAPLFLRLNAQKNQALIVQALNNKNINHQTTHLPGCLLLPEAHSVDELPGFYQGDFSIQDISAQYAGFILQPQDNEVILDACAAPGGKTTHLLELCPNIELIVLEKNKQRLTKITDNLRRLQQSELNINIKHQDARAPIGSGECFDKILLDAPCSATGVIRRHPDIKVLRSADEVANIVKLQKEILDNLWNFLKPGGLLLYVSCSILPPENSEQMAKFLARHPNAEVIDIPLLSAYQSNIGYQILPNTQQGDGFYYCLLEKALPANKLVD